MSMPSQSLPPANPQADAGNMIAAHAIVAGSGTTLVPATPAPSVMKSGVQPSPPKN